MATKYTVRYELDEDGWWVATAKGLQGVHSQGRSLAAARSRIREAIEAATDSKDFEVKDTPQLPADARKAVTVAREAREESEKRGQRAQAALRTAAVLLTGRLDLSVRDAAELLGVSHQRVQQLVNE